MAVRLQCVSLRSGCHYASMRTKTPPLPFRFLTLVTCIVIGGDICVTVENVVICINSACGLRKLCKPPKGGAALMSNVTNVGGLRSVLSQLFVYVLFMCVKRGITLPSDNGVCMCVCVRVRERESK